MDFLHCLKLKKINNKRFNKQTPTLQLTMLFVTPMAKKYSTFIFQNTDRECNVIFVMLLSSDVTPAVPEWDYNSTSSYR